MEQQTNGWEEGETRLDRVLETVVERARSLVDARTVMVLLEDRGLLVVAATTGDFKVERRGVRLQADGSAWRHVMAEGEAERVAPVGGRLGMSLDELGVVANAALLVPLSYRGRAIGVLAAFDRTGEDRGVRGRGRIASDGLCSERRDGAHRGAVDGRGAPARVDRRRRTRAGALGARAPRRDPAGPGSAASAPVGVAPARPQPRWARRWRPRLP